MNTFKIKLFPFPQMHSFSIPAKLILIICIEHAKLGLRGSDIAMKEE